MAISGCRNGAPKTSSFPLCPATRPGPLLLKNSIFIKTAKIPPTDMPWNVREMQLRHPDVRMATCAGSTEDSSPKSRNLKLRGLSLTTCGNDETDSSEVFLSALVFSVRVRNE